MYEKYWSLNDRPFRNTPDPHYLYFSRQHEEAMTRMLYTITEGQGAMMLTGDYGCGKTLLSHILLDELDPERFEVALIHYPNLSATELLQEILRQFGYDTQGMNKVQLLQLLQGFLLANQACGCMTLIIIDEAQMVLDRMTMEEIRLLLNFQQDRRFLLTLFLLGQPELRQRIQESPQLLERLSIRFHVGNFDEEEALTYLTHRLEIAGGTNEIFTREAERMIVTASQGVPRRINNLADMALMLAFGQKAPVVDEEIVHRVVADMEG
jgi:general secretion pathway protein A